MVTHSTRRSIPLRFWLKAGANAVFSKLEQMAATGDFSVEQLNEISRDRAIRSEPELKYYLASLYLLIVDLERASELLTGVPARSAMKRYCAVLSHCREFSHPMPGLTKRQERSLSNIESRLSSLECLTRRIVRSGGFSVIGNAPSPPREHRGDLCSFYFNDYRRNPAMNGLATVHVVTPSWKSISTIQSESVLITGVSTFHRRSRVWQRFDEFSVPQAIYTVPRTLWSALTMNLNASPTAGLLVLSLIDDLLRSEALSSETLEAYIDGFSVTPPAVNHSYDKVKVSQRHNWRLEPALVAEVIRSLQRQVGVFNSPIPVAGV